jgi:hypothetical protein
VKGVFGHPEDGEAMQSQKHASIRIQESGHATFRGLSIINHQRGLPGLERENEMPFRKEIVSAAIPTRTGGSNRA